MLNKQYKFLMKQVNLKLEEKELILFNNKKLKQMNKYDDIKRNILIKFLIHLFAFYNYLLYNNFVFIALFHCKDVLKSKISLNKSIKKLFLYTLLSKCECNCIDVNIIKLLLQIKLLVA
jgi:hypothetical protein